MAKKTVQTRKKATMIKTRTQSACDLYINVPLTREKFRLTDILLSTTIIDLKEKLELVAGIPTNLQRLQYLDKEDLIDNTDLRRNDVVPSGTLTLQIWRTWEKLVSDVCSGNIEGVLNRDFLFDAKPADIDPTLLRLKESDMKYRMSIALFIASHRGKRELVDRLITDGTHINATTKFGRTPLHAAAASDQSKCIDLLLERGASTEIVDGSGKTPSTVANEFGNRGSEKKLFLFQWQKRAESTKPKKTDSRLMMHQQFDSGFPIWRKGRYQQVYLCKTLPVGEFIGTAINAPKTKSLKPPFQDMPKEKIEEMMVHYNPKEEGDSEDEDIGFPKSSIAHGSKSFSAGKLHRSERVLKSHNDWLLEKEMIRKEQKMLDLLLKREEEKLKPWEKETKHGKRIEGKVMSFQQWQEEKSKHKPGGHFSSNEEKPKKRIEVYEDYDTVPVFEKQFLQRIDPLDPSTLKS